MTSQAATPLPNIDAMGKGFDSLTFDLYNPGAANKNKIFAYGNDATTQDGKYEYPSQFNFSELNASSFDAESYQIYSAYDLQQSSAEQISIGGGFEDFTFSGSQSYKNFQQMTGSSENVATESHSIVELWRLTLQQNAALPLSSDFKSAVAALPTDYASGKADYASFIQNYGTHYCSDAIFGGRSYQLYTMNTTQAAKLVSQDVDTSVEAGIALAVNVGTTSSSSNQSYLDFINTVSQETVQWVGGTPAQNFDSWAATVANAPEIVLATLNPIYDLFTSANFSGVSNIGEIQTNMQQAYSDYMTGNGQSAGVYEIGTLIWVPGASLNDPNPYNFLLVSAQADVGPDASGPVNSPLPYFAGQGGGRLSALSAANPSGGSSKINVGEDIFIGAIGYTEVAPWLIGVMQAQPASSGLLSGFGIDNATETDSATWQMVNPLSLEQSGKLLSGTGYLYQIKNPSSGQYVKIGPGNFGANSGLLLTTDSLDPMTYWTIQAIPQVT